MRKFLLMYKLFDSDQTQLGYYKLIYRKIGIEEKVDITRTYKNTLDQSTGSLTVTIYENFI